MTQKNAISPWRILRYILIAMASVAFFVTFIVWRTDNPRIETLRFTIMDRYSPSMDWLYTPFSSIGNMVSNFQSYEQLTRENRELRQQIQQMESWREAALQLEQINAELRALNNLSVTPSFSYVTGEVIADSGTPFSQTALINIGRNKGVQVGAPAVDGFGVIGRVIGVGDDKSRILLLTDPSSQVSALIMPERIRAIVRGSNGHDLDIEAIEGGAGFLAGSRVLTSGAGVFPEGLLLGYIAKDANGRPTVRIAADYSALELARVLLPSQSPDVPFDNQFIDPEIEGSEAISSEAGENDEAATSDGEEDADQSTQDDAQ